MRRHHNRRGFMSFLTSRSVVSNLLVLAILALLILMIWDTSLKKAYKIALTIITILIFIFLWTNGIFPVGSY